MNEWRKAKASMSNGHCVEVKWRKAEASHANNNCAEVGPGDGTVCMHNSRHPDGPVLEFTPAEWAAFLHGVKAGEFDDLLHVPPAGATSRN